MNVVGTLVLLKIIPIPLILVIILNLINIISLIILILSVLYYYIYIVLYYSNECRWNISVIKDNTNIANLSMISILLLYL